LKQKRITGRAAVRVRALNLFFFLFLGSQTKREKEKGATVIERKIEIRCHLFPAKEEFVFLSFVLSFGNNLYYVIVRFECIGALGSE
jgi:phosphosulfolactate synthase (CoM biosynthesis protein A)